MYFLLTFCFLLINLPTVNSKTKEVGLSNCDTVFYYETAINNYSNFLGNRHSCDKDAAILFATNCIYSKVMCKLFSGKVKEKKRNYIESKLKLVKIPSDEIPTDIDGKGSIQVRTRDFYEKINELKNNYRFFWIAELTMNCYHVFHEIRFKSKKTKNSIKLNLYNVKKYEKIITGLKSHSKEFPQLWAMGRMLTQNRYPEIVRLIDNSTAMTDSDRIYFLNRLLKKIPDKQRRRLKQILLNEKKYLSQDEVIYKLSDLLNELMELIEWDQ